MLFMNDSKKKYPLGERLQSAARKKFGSVKAQSKLVEASGVSQSVVGRIWNGSVKDSSYTPYLAEACDVRAVWLASGTGRVSDSMGEGVSDSSALYRLEGSVRRVPVLSPELISEWLQGGLNPDAQEDVSFVVTSQTSSLRTFALTVRDNSMWGGSPDSPTYKRGDIVVADPALASKAESGSRVIALLTDESIGLDRRILFKELVIDGPLRYLRSLSAGHLPIHQDFEVVALVLHAITSE